MTVFLLLLIFILLAYLLAYTPLGARIISVVDEMVAQARGPGRPTAAGPPERPGYREWLMTDAEVPDDLRLWYLGLDETQAQRFESALHAHAKHTGLHLVSLISGDLDHQPTLRTIYVEAVSIYSQAYRKAREAIEVAEQGQEPAAEAAEPAAQSRSGKRVDGKEVAEKRVSRRRSAPAQAGSAPAA